MASTVGVTVQIAAVSANIADLKAYVDRCYEFGAEDDFALELDEAGNLLLSFDV